MAVVSNLCNIVFNISFLAAGAAVWPSVNATAGKVAVTYGLQQWAAVTTHWGWMRVPPQTWKFKNRMEA